MTPFLLGFLIEDRFGPQGRVGPAELGFNERGARGRKNGEHRKPKAEDGELTVCYLTSKITLSKWLLNSGAYLHWISAMSVPPCPAFPQDPLLRSSF